VSPSTAGTGHRAAASITSPGAMRDQDRMGHPQRGGGHADSQSHRHRGFRRRRARAAVRQDRTALGGVDAPCFRRESRSPRAREHSHGAGQLLLSNHVSFFDVLAISHIVPKRYRFVGKQELTRVPLWGRAWQAAGHVAIDRTDTQRAIDGPSTASRSSRGRTSAPSSCSPRARGPPRANCSRSRRARSCSRCTPASRSSPWPCQGSRDILPKGSWRVRSGRIIVRFGRPSTRRATAGNT
jgi:hypothetical protein